MITATAKRTLYFILTGKIKKRVNYKMGHGRKINTQKAIQAFVFGFLMA